MDIKIEKLDAPTVGGYIVPRRVDAYKNEFGHVLIVAGSPGMTGAAALCAHGCLRAGAGLVTVALPQSLLPVFASQARPEAMVLPLPESEPGILKGTAIDRIKEFIARRRVTALVVGPGIGHNAEAAKLVAAILSTIELPVVLDADGISLLSGEKDRGLEMPSLKNAAADIIMTPHPGELSRATGIPINELQSKRSDMAALFAAKNGVICVLKGAGTIISDGKTACVNTTGNPGMATAGTGDVLAGIIAALLSQVQEPRLLHAACAGAFLHGLAGDIVLRSKTEISLLAGDIAEAIPEAVACIIKECELNDEK